MVARKHACELGASPRPKVMVMTAYAFFNRAMDNGMEYPRNACLNTDVVRLHRKQWPPVSRGCQWKAIGDT
jgi:hypothetical protein